MKALPKRKGNAAEPPPLAAIISASMKALPKRKGNRETESLAHARLSRLNESPSEKEGKFQVCHILTVTIQRASMKALPKRKGNAARVFQLKNRNLASMKALPKRKGNWAM